jgi:hypothetical protein
MILASLFMTIILSAVAAAMITFRINESRESKHFIGKKAEELYCSAEAVDRELSRYFGDRYSILGFNQRGAGLETDALQRAGAKLVEAKMLVGFYFPALSSTLARTIAAATTAHASLRAWERSDEVVSDELLVRLDKDIVDLKDALESFKGAIIDDGRGLNRPTRRAIFKRQERLAMESRVLRVVA